MVIISINECRHESERFNEIANNSVYEKWTRVLAKEVRQVSVSNCLQYGFFKLRR